VNFVFIRENFEKHIVEISIVGSK